MNPFKSLTLTRILTANKRYHEHEYRLRLLLKLLKENKQSSLPKRYGFEFALEMEIQAAYEDKKEIQEYIKEKMVTILGNRYFGEVLNSEILENTISTSPIDHISNYEIGNKEVIFNELITNQDHTHFIGCRPLTLNLVTGVLTPGDISKIKIIKIPKVA